MKTIMTTVLLYAGLCIGQLTGEDVMKESSAHIKKLKSIRYNIYSQNSQGTYTAEVIQTRKKEYPIFGVAQIKVTGIELNDHGSYQISWASNGNQFEFYDNKKNSIILIDTPNDQKLFRSINSTILLPFNAYYQKDPLDVILKIEKRDFTLLKDTTIYAVPCYAVLAEKEIVHDVMGKINLNAIWYIGKKDFLVYGTSNKSSKSFIKVKEIDKEYVDEDFSISKGQSIEKITGLEPVSEGLLSVGVKAPDWTLPSSTAEKIKLEKLRGKVVLLDFWGTWCVPCIRAMPEIQSIYDHFKGKDVEVIGVSVEMEKVADPIAFAKKKGFTYPIVIDGTTITEKYKVIHFPSIYLIDKSGKIIHAEHSANRANFKEDIISKINEALK